MSSIPAVYESGVFRPLEPLDLPSGTRATVVYTLSNSSKPWDEFFNTLPDDDAKEMIDAIEEAFGQVEEP